MSKKQPKQENKVQVTRRIDHALWERLQAFAGSQDPIVTDTAVIEAALRRYLDAREDALAARGKR